VSNDITFGLLLARLSFHYEVQIYRHNDISHICCYINEENRLILYIPVFLLRHQYVKITRGQIDGRLVNDVPGKYIGGSGRGLVEARYSVFPWTD
jgi:hypothetical protein